MLKLLRSRWVQYLLGALGVFVVGLAAGFITSREEIPPERPDHVVLNAGSAELARPIPLTDDEAIEKGWEDPFECIATQAGRPSKTPGRYFAKEEGGERIPYLLVYTKAGPLLGIYLFSQTEMPLPWAHQEVRLSAVDTMDFEHWGLHIHFRDRFEACGEFRLEMHI